MNDSAKAIFIIAVLMVSVVFAVVFFHLQVWDESYQSDAKSNMMDKIVQRPYRGLIYDRTQKLLVYNTPVYDLVVVPRELGAVDTLSLARVLRLPKHTVQEKIARAIRHARNKPSLLFEGLSPEDFARIQEDLVEFSGIHVKTRSIREYSTPYLANALGYVGEITPEQLEKDDENYYLTNDNIGITGLEAQYEKALRGKKGMRFSMVNAAGEEVGRFQKGAYDIPSVPGKHITLSIDSTLQAYAEQLIAGKVGSIVAIEPSTGKILSFVSSPSYNPNLLRGMHFEEYYKVLIAKKEDPIFIRPTMAQYRPGSTFKIALTLAALEEGVINPDSVLPCDRRIINCHPHGPYENLVGAITHSCNPYFYRVMQRLVLQGKKSDVYSDVHLGLERWKNYMHTLGFGRRLGVDLPHEKRGNIPGSAYYDSVYGPKRWSYYTIYSLSIGEGENLVVPLQMVNFVCIIANRGHYYQPHFVTHIGGISQAYRYREKKEIPIKKEHFLFVVDAMRRVVVEGTGQWRANLPDISVCGKTGSVQNKDLLEHSVFISFAPMEAPKIALSVYVEEAGEGGGMAAAISGLLIEKYLKGDKARLYMEGYVQRNKMVAAK